MKFLLDANMPHSSIRALTERGHDAVHVRDIGLGDSTDERIDRYACEQGLALITRDLDFCDIRIYPPETSPGRVVLRISNTSTAAEIGTLLGRFLQLSQLVARIPGHLVILDPDKVRFRPGLPNEEANPADAPSA